MFYHYHFDIFPSIYMQFRHNLESVINATLSIYLIIDNSTPLEKMKTTRETDIR